MPYAMCRIGASVVEYHAAAKIKKRLTYDPRVFQYIGLGYIWSIKGRECRGKELLEFYRLRDDRPRYAR